MKIWSDIKDKNPDEQHKFYHDCLTDKNCHLYACCNFFWVRLHRERRKGEITLITYNGRMSRRERPQIKCKTNFHECTCSNWLLFERVWFYMYLLSIWFRFGGHTIVNKFPRSHPPSQCPESFNTISQESWMLFWILRDRWIWNINMSYTLSNFMLILHCPHFWT